MDECACSAVRLNLCMSMRDIRKPVGKVVQSMGRLYPAVIHPLISPVMRPTKNRPSLPAKIVSMMRTTKCIVCGLELTGNFQRA